MDGDGVAKSPLVLSHRDVFDEFSSYIPEDARNAFAEKLAALVESPEAVPRAVVETTSTPSTAMVTSSGTAANPENTSLKTGKSTLLIYIHLAHTQLQ